MNAHRITKNDHNESESHTAVRRAIDWLRGYVDEHPYAHGAEEARSIINGLQAVRVRPALDELLTLIGQIARSDQGLQEINRAKIRMGQTEQRIEKDHENKKQS